MTGLGLGRPLTPVSQLPSASSQVGLGAKARGEGNRRRRNGTGLPHNSLRRVIPAIVCIHWEKSEFLTDKIKSPAAVELLCDMSLPGGIPGLIADGWQGSLVHLGQIKRRMDP